MPSDQQKDFWDENFIAKEKKGKSEGFDNCDRPSNLAQIWSKSNFLVVFFVSIE